MTDHHDPDPRTTKTLADAEALTGAPCKKCGARLSGHDAVFCLVLGYKGAPHCLPFIADHMAEPLDSLRQRALSYIDHHDCFAAAWRRATEQEGSEAPARPGCAFADDSDALASASQAADVQAADVLAADAQAHTIQEPDSDDRSGQVADATWDAGGMGCGDLVLELRLRLAKLPAGGLFDLRATDPGAPADLPAWCSMTGHTLVAARHPDYRIRRRP